MDEQKNQEQPELNEAPEEYSFLQEVIKDEAGGPKRLKAKILRMIGLGFIFGIVACFSFCLLYPVISEHLSGNPEEVTIPKDTEEEPEGEVTEAEKEKPEEEFAVMMDQLDEAARKVRKSVAEIRVISPEGNSEKTVDSVEKLSGVIMADNGQELLILGQAPGGKNGEKIEIVLADETVHPAALKMEDVNLDLCVYSINRADISEKTWEKISVAALGSSYAVQTGNIGILLGKPFGTEDAVSYGKIISYEEKAKKADGEYGFIGVEAAGFSGGSGVIANLEGQIIGVISHSIFSDGAGANDGRIYGYGISDIKGILELLSNGSSIPYVGILGTDVTEEMSEQRGIPSGVYVDEIEADSPAMEAGVQCGDVITSINGESVSRMQFYNNQLMDQKEGDTLQLQGFRKGAGGEYVDISFTVTVGIKK